MDQLHEKNGYYSHRKAAGLLVISSLLMSFTSQAAEVNIKLSNITNGIYFTPILFSAHDTNQSLFNPGQSATLSLKSMAEGGDISGLSSDATNMGATVGSAPASGLIVPGSSVAVDLSTNSLQTHLSLTGMMLPSNDGFVGLDSWLIPALAGTYTLYLNAYDAGTEANSEIVADMPAPPVLGLGTGGTGVTTSIPNAQVHIHPGNLGDFNLTGGISDIKASGQRWLNPVAMLTVTVK